MYDGGYDSYLAEREVARRHAREAYEEYDDKLGALKDRAQMQRNWMAAGRAQRPSQGHRQRQDRPQQPGRDQREAGREGPPDRADDRAAGGGRGAAQGVGAADDDRRRAALGHRGGVADGRRRAAGLVHARAGRRAGRLGRPGRRSPARTAPARPRCWARCSAGSRSTRAAPGSARACGSARSTRRAGCSWARSRWRGRSATPCRTGRTPDVRTLLAKFGLTRRPRAAARRARCRPASAPGPRWRCCRPAR